MPVGASAGSSLELGVVGSNRHSSRGFQNRSTTTPASRLATAETMSTSSNPTKFDQRNWTPANVPPIDQQAGQTARSRASPIIVRTSQNGMISERSGKIRPDVALERLDVQPGHLAQGQDRRADRPPGDRGRVGDQAEQGRLERPEPQADQERRRDRHRGPEPGRPLDERPEREGDQHRLEPPVAREPGDRRLHHVELAGRHRDVVEEDRRHDQPDDPEQGEDDADPRAGQRPASAGIPKTRPPRAAVTSPASAACQALARPEARRPSSTRTGKAATKVETGQYPERVIVLRPHGASSLAPAVSTLNSRVPEATLTAHAVRATYDTDGRRSG